MLWKRNETKPIGLILHLKKFDIYHTIFSNKDDHINIKKYFQKTTKYKIIFFHHITKWVMPIFIICILLTFEKKYYFLKYQGYYHKEWAICTFSLISLS